MCVCNLCVTLGKKNAYDCGSFVKTSLRCDSCLLSTSDEKPIKTSCLIPSKLHHMALNLCINEHLYTLQYRNDKFVFSGLLGSGPRAAFYLPSTILACKQQLIHSQCPVSFTHYSAKKVWIISLSGWNSI